MSRKLHFVLSLLLVMSFTLAACSAPAPTAATSATQTTIAPVAPSETSLIPSDTPLPSDTPTLTLPPPTATPSPTRLITDQFSDSRFEGSWNPNLWSCDGWSPAIAGQKSGAFRIQMAALPQITARDLASINSWTSDQLMFVQADLKMDSYTGTKHADVHVQIWADLTGYKWWTSCDLGVEAGTLDQTAVVCHINRLYPNNSNTAEYTTKSMPVKAGTSHTVRIAIERGTFNLSYYMDDVLIGSQTPQDADQLKSTMLKAHAGIFTEGAAFTSDITNFIAGER